jgi:hypothetical protein
MRQANDVSRILGVAFLLQFVTSFSRGVFLQPALIAPGNIHETMVKIANNAGLMRASILLDMLTALGIIFLGAMLFISVRKQNEKMALTALGFYILEAALLAASRSEAFSLLRISEEYVAAGQPPPLQALASLALESMEFVGSTLHMLAFCLGGILFYYLLYQSRLVPRALSLWGLITVFPLLVGTVTQVFGYTLPMFLYFPYVPFEFVIGIWILVKGTSETPEIQQSRLVPTEAH